MKSKKITEQIEYIKSMLTEDFSGTIQAMSPTPITVAGDVVKVGKETKLDKEKQEDEKELGK